MRKAPIWPGIDFWSNGWLKSQLESQPFWLFRFLHEMNRKLLIEARPIDRITKRHFLFKKRAPSRSETIILNFLFLLTRRLKISCQQLSEEGIRSIFYYGLKNPLLYFRKHKFEVLNWFKNFNVLIEKQLGK